MTHFSPRLTHVLTRADLATLLTPTYADAQGVDDDEAHDRVTRALEDPELVEDLYEEISRALEAHKGPRTDADGVINKLSKAVETRKGRVKPAAASPGVSAVLVRINLANGLAPDAMRAVMESDKGRAALAAGLRALGAHLVKELVK